MEFPEKWDECAQKGIENYSHEVWFGCIERLCQAEQILCDNTTVQGKLWQKHLEENKNWMRSKSPLVRLTTIICKTKIGEVMVHTVLNTCVVLGNFYCWVNTRNDLPGEQTNCLRPFSSVKKWLPSLRTCLKTRSSFLGLVTRWSFQKPLHRWTSSEPPGLFPHELEQFFFTVAGKGMACTGKSVLYLASVHLSIWKCLFMDHKLGHLEKIYAIVWYRHKIAMFQKNTFI